MRRSHLSEVPAEKFLALVEASTSLADVCRKLGYSANSTTTVRKRMVELGVDLEAFAERRVRRGGRRIPDDEVFVRNSSYAQANLKRRVMADRLLPYECQECGQEPEWRGKKLVLVLDHINGDCRDHRKENLRFLCPNCNSQTETFAGKNQRHRSTVSVCICGGQKNSQSTKCRACVDKACETG